MKIEETEKKLEDEEFLESNTPYDDVCRTILLECDDLVIFLINEIFGENFSKEDKIIRQANEHFIEGQGGAEKKRITDGLLRIISERDHSTRGYHIECESSRGSDGTILIRIFEYAAQIALDDGEVDRNQDNEVVLKVEFPNSAVICLRSSEKRDRTDQCIIRIKTPGGECRYRVPFLRIRKYGIEELFAKKLYFLIPFYIFNMEDDLPEIEEEEEKRTQLLKTYSQILEKLSDVEKTGEISTFSYEAIKTMTKKVVYHIAAHQMRIKKGIGDLMGGKVLDFEAKRIRDAARDEGRKEGRKEGRNEGIDVGINVGKIKGEDLKLIKQVHIKLEKGQKPEVIAEALEETVPDIIKICDAINEAGSQFDAEQVYQRMQSSRA